VFSFTLLLHLSQQQRIHTSRQAAIPHAFNQQRLAQLHRILNLPQQPGVCGTHHYQPQCPLLRSYPAAQAAAAATTSNMIVAQVSIQMCVLALIYLSQVHLHATAHPYH
jgi:hypothetical protein